jgi:hypothetical protein
MTGDLTFITFGMTCFILSSWLLYRNLLKSRHTIKLFGISNLISSFTSNHFNLPHSSNQMNFSGRVSVDNYVNSGIDIPVENAHVIIQIIPEPTTVSPMAVNHPIQYNNKFFKTD